MIKVHLIDFSLPAPVEESVWASSITGQEPDGAWVREERIVQIPCCVCSGYSAEFAPLRRVIRTKVVDRRDPTEVYMLACGHTAL